jgi:hypothetical protein
MSAKKEKIVEILERYEDYLSDGYVFYSDDVQATLLIIADEIITVIDTKEQSSSSHDTTKAEICPYHKCDIKFAGSIVVSKVDFCTCGGKLSPHTASPKPETRSPNLPPLYEVKKHVSSEMWRGAFKTDSMSITELAYDFILKYRDD